VTFSSSIGQMSQMWVYRLRLQTQIGNYLFFWSTPKPHLSFLTMSFPEGSLKVISSPVSTRLLVRTGPTQTHVSQSLAQSDGASCGTSPHSLRNDKLAITSTDTLQLRCDRRPAEIMTGFILLSAEMEDRSISVLVCCNLISPLREIQRMQHL